MSAGVDPIWQILGLSPMSWGLHTSRLGMGEEWLSQPEGRCLRTKPAIDETKDCCSVDLGWQYPLCAPALCGSDTRLIWSTGIHRRPSRWYLASNQLYSSPFSQAKEQKNTVRSLKAPRGGVMSG